MCPLFYCRFCKWIVYIKNRYTVYKYLIIPKNKLYKTYIQTIYFIVPFQKKIEIKHENIIEYKPYQRDFSSISIHTQRYGGNRNTILDKKFVVLASIDFFLWIFIPRDAT